MERDEHAGANPRKRRAPRHPIAGAAGTVATSTPRMAAAANPTITGPGTVVPATPRATRASASTTTASARTPTPVPTDTGPIAVPPGWLTSPAQMHVRLPTNMYAPRRSAIAYFYYQMGCPSESEWYGEGGVISKIRNKCEMRKRSNGVVLRVLHAAVEDGMLGMPCECLLLLLLRARGSHGPP